MWTMIDLKVLSELEYVLQGWMGGGISEDREIGEIYKKKWV